MRTPTPWILPTAPATRATLLASGASDEMIESQLASGRLLRVRHGIYLAAASWPADPAAQHVTMARAEQTLMPAAVLSHNTAALVWGLPTPGFREWYDDPPSLTVPAGVTARPRRGAATRRTALLPATDVTRDAEGYAVTTVSRTAVDLADGLPLPEALVVLDAAGRLLIESMATRPRRGDYANPRLVRTVRQMLAASVRPHRSSRLMPAVEKTEPCRESPAESLTAGQLYLAGLPIPVFQAPIPSPWGTFWPDCYWPQARLIGECDGAVKYVDQAAIVKEKEREQWFRDQSYGVVRWLAKEIAVHPGRVMARIEAALG